MFWFGLFCSVRPTFFRYRRTIWRLAWNWECCSHLSSSFFRVLCINAPRDFLGLRSTHHRTHSPEHRHARRTGGCVGGQDDRVSRTLPHRIVHEMQTTLQRRRLQAHNRRGESRADVHALPGIREAGHRILRREPTDEVSQVGEAGYEEGGPTVGHGDL